MTGGRRTALVLAAVLSMAFAGTASAATSGTVTESAVVNSTLSLVLSTTTIDYGATDPGATSAPATVTMDVTGNVAFAVMVAGTDLTNGTGGTIPTTARSWRTDAGEWQPFVSGAMIKSGTTAGVHTVVDWQLAVPSGQAPGTYHGTLTFTVSAL